MNKVMLWQDDRRGGDGVPTGAAQGVSGLAAAVNVAQLDAAVDRAARETQCVVGEYVAAPAGEQFPALIELAIDFLVPPVSVARYAAGLDAELRRANAAYASQRRRNQVLAPVVRLVPPGVFHQWRITWRLSQTDQHARRWSGVRQTLEGVLHQSEFGWRDAS